MQTTAEALNSVQPDSEYKMKLRGLQQDVKGPKVWPLGIQKASQSDLCRRAITGKKSVGFASKLSITEEKIGKIDVVQIKGVGEQKKFQKTSCHV